MSPKKGKAKKKPVTPGKIRRKKSGVVADSESARKLQQFATGLKRRSTLVRRGFDVVGNELKRELPGNLIPAGVDANVYLAIRKLSSIAYRDNKGTMKTKCPHCKRRHDAKIPSPTCLQLERNSLAAISALFDRLAPKLSAISMDVDTTQLGDQLSEIFTNAMMKFVPAETLQECYTYFREQYEAYQNAKTPDGN